MSPSSLRLDRRRQARDRAARRLRWSAGLTLVELLTSMMVASIIMVALLQSLTSASESWTRQSKHFSSQREGRVAMRLLADDLAALTVVPAWARSAAPELPVPEDDDTPPPTGSRDFRTGYFLQVPTEPVGSARLAFLRASKNDDRSPDFARGDLRLVHYGVALTTDGGASGLAPQARSQKLVRRMLSPAETFRRLQAHLTTGAPLVTDADWQALEQLLNEPGIAEVGVIAHDVIRFDLRPFRDLITPGTTIDIPVWQPVNWLDVTLRVTNRQTGQYLQTLADWQGQGERAPELLNGTRDVFDDDPEVRTYTSRLRLRSAEL